MSCVDGNWKVTYSDGNTQTTNAVCETAPMEPDPTPTETPTTAPLGM